MWLLEWVEIHKNSVRIWGLMVPGGYTLSMTLTPSEWSWPQSQSTWCPMTLFLVTPDATVICYEEEYNYVFPNPLMSFLFIFNT